ncbi:hypothetical protein M0802_000545 [Mischocyttarus mexicanus]|nr:hypothetical protein M0802_000545 [Mischocyttarus mexicanus]
MQRRTHDSILPIANQNHKPMLTAALGVVGAQNLSAMECRKGRRKGLLGGLLLAWLLTSSGRTVVARNMDVHNITEDSHSERGRIEQLLDHLSISSESTTVHLRELRDLIRAVFNKQLFAYVSKEISIKVTSEHRKRKVKREAALRAVIPEFFITEFSKNVPLAAANTEEDLLLRGEQQQRQQQFLRYFVAIFVQNVFVPSYCTPTIPYRTRLFRVVKPSIQRRRRKLKGNGKNRLSLAICHRRVYHGQPFLSATQSPTHLYYATPCHTIPYYNIPHHTVPYHTTPHSSNSPFVLDLREDLHYKYAPSKIREYGKCRAIFVYRLLFYTLSTTFTNASIPSRHKITAPQFKQCKFYVEKSSAKLEQSIINSLEIYTGAT